MNDPSPMLEPSQAVIAARSEQQAMDWSLVLSSQGIGSTIQRSEEGGWRIEVDPPDYLPAMAAIRLYRRENRRFRWRQPLPWSGWFFHWGVLGWGLALVLFFALPAWQGIDLRPAGCVDNAAMSRGEWWRPFTSVTLHGDAGHLAANLGLGGILLGLAMARYGYGIGLLAAYAAGVLGGWAGWLIYPETHRSVGASGMVMGALGLLMVSELWRGQRTPVRWGAPAILAGVMLFALTGTNPTSDFVAHGGGFFAGALLGLPLSRAPAPPRQGRWLDIAALGLLVGVVMAAWIRAAGLSLPG
ncbi:MAG TPA: rhomboid family intramembrane serine protease [Candidatus Paceibacterota bacterium]|nr:rhomboid family intramembrane serine protease [Candidatus Paceibacterota bacterium]